MTSVSKKSYTCPVCGANTAILPMQNHMICPHCRAEHHSSPIDENLMTTPNPALSSHLFQDIRRLRTYISSERPLIFAPQPAINNLLHNTDLRVMPLPDTTQRASHCAPEHEHEHEQGQAIWAGDALLFSTALNDTMHLWSQHLSPGGLLYMALPILRKHGTTAFQGHEHYRLTNRNIMMLLERHGFLLQWRSLRFQPLLRLIARKV